MRFSKSRSRRSTRRKINSRGLRVEGLEGRKLLAAAIMDTAPIDSANYDAAIVSTINTQDPINSQEPSAIVGRIVNGERTDAHENVGIVNGGCSGTLISPTHVLTAAHCVETFDGGVIGDRDGTFTVNGETYRTVKVSSHPGYNSATLANDIAIMELDRPVVGVTPAQIMREAPQVGQMLTIVGFGQGGTTNNPIDDFGNKRVGETPIDSVSSTLISWNFDAGESNTAPGDSGGPAFVTINGQQFLAGVTSGGTSDPHTIGDNSFDTRVDAFANWIDAQVNNTTPTDPVTPVDPPTNPTDPPSTPVDPPVDDTPQFVADTASQLAEQELADYDTDQNGSLSESELTQEFLDFDFSNSEAAQAASDLVNEFDADGNGELSLAELVVSWGGDANVSDDVSDPIVPVDPVAPPSDASPGLQTPEQLAAEELSNYDTDENGSLSLEEMTAEFVSQGLPEAAAANVAQRLFDAYDMDENQQLSYDELVVSWGGNTDGGEPSDSGVEDVLDTPDNDIPNPVDAGGESAESLATAELQQYDTDGSGTLSGAELTAEFVESGMSDQEATDYTMDLIAWFDVDGDQELSLSELITSWSDDGDAAAVDSTTGDLHGDHWSDDQFGFDLGSDDMWADNNDWWGSAFAIDF